ncbi:MAG: response regulator [Verrucomicrobiales bacterium]|nr:response regulator [Verrucomicrobiales bacterium]
MPYLLIVDDDVEFAESVGTVCEAEGHTVKIVHAASEALPAVRERRPDGVLLDVMFPEDSSAGFQVARDLRHDFPDLPILMLTAVNQRFPLGFSTKDIDPTWLPVTDFVEKPVDFAVLKEKVAWLLSRKPDQA